MEVRIAAPEVKPHIRAAIARLRHLPASSVIVHRALASLEGPDYDASTLKKLLLSDQGVAARILRLANSAYFGFRSEVRTVSQAVVLLGQERIRTLLYRILVDKLLADMGQAEAGAAPIRRLSLTTAAASCLLSQFLLREDPEIMLLAGLLHNVGDLFLWSQFEEEYRRILEGEDSVEVIGTPVGRAGGLLLESWGFPALYAAACEFCLHPGQSPESLATAVFVVHAGRRIAEGWIARATPQAGFEAMDRAAADSLGLDPEGIAEVYASLPRRMSLDQLYAFGRPAA